MCVNFPKCHSIKKNAFYHFSLNDKKNEPQINIIPHHHHTGNVYKISIWKIKVGKIHKEI